MVTTILIEEQIEIPLNLHSLADFRDWAVSDQFPETGCVRFDLREKASPKLPGGRPFIRKPKIWTFGDSSREPARAHVARGRPGGWG